MFAEGNSRSLRWSPAFWAALATLCLASTVACQSDAGTTRSADGAAIPLDGEIPDVDTLTRWELSREHPQDIARGLHPDAPVDVRVRATLALARLQHQQAVGALTAALRDPAPKVREVAAFGLGQLDEAFDDKRTTHQAARARIETQLTGSVNQEDSVAVRKAIATALGRVGREKGLRTLASLASAGPIRAAALTAIGVNATRWNPLTPTPDLLATVIRSGLQDADPSVQKGAAYAAFRQQLELRKTDVDAIVRASTPEARIHLLRALALSPAHVTPEHLDSWMRDLDWRVRHRALLVASAAMKAGADIPPRVLEAPLNEAIDRLARGQIGGDAHVVVTACQALAKTHPTDGRHILDRALRKMEPLLPKYATTRCGCAVARDAIDGELGAIKRCHGGTFDATAARRLEVAVVREAGIPSVVRAKSLQVALTDAERLVRVDAATVAAEDDAPAIAQMARAALLNERDPGVIAAHLGGFVGKRREEIFGQLDLSKVVRTLLAKASKDALEPLLLAAQIASERGFTSTTALLIEAEDTRVVDAARDVALFDRPLGPRSSVPDAPVVSSLPSSVTVTTSRGVFTIDLFREVAPVTVSTFVALAKQGVTIGTTFHRVVPDFVAQGGDPRGDGYGGPGFTIPCERSALTYSSGTVGMALAGLDTGGSQFFMVHSDQPHLDGRYSIFGRVVSGKDVADALVPSDRLIRFTFEGAELD